MRNKLQSAIIAGGIIALLSVIPFLGYGFFFWAIAGGVLASYLYIKKSPTPVQIADGLLLGAMWRCCIKAATDAVGLVISFCEEPNHQTQVPHP